MAVDGAGNATVTGDFGGVVSAGPAAGLSTSGPTDADVLVARFDPAGNLAWAKALGGTGYDGGKGIAADDAGVYVTGFFTGTANFGGVSLTSAGAAADIFVTRLDPATGATVYAARAGGNDTSDDFGNAIAVDAGHNAYVTGIYYGTADFGASTLAVSGTFHDAPFLAKVDPSGQFAWAQTATGFQDVTVDRSSSAVYLTTQNGVTRFDGNGQAVWERTFVSLLSNLPTNVAYTSALTTDAGGNVYVRVGGSEPISFGPGGPQLFNGGGVIAKLSAGGDFLAGWQPGGAGGIGVDGAGNIYDAGTFTGTVPFDTGVQTINRTASGSNPNLFLLQISQDQGGIFGQLFLDSNQNGVRDTGETPLGARTVYVDLNNNGVRNTGEPFAVTGPGGGYRIGHLAAGTYNVRQELPTDFSSTTTPSPLTLSAGQFVAGFDFGSFSPTAVHTYNNNTPMSISGGIKKSTITITDNLTINDLNIRVNITHSNVWKLAVMQVPKLIAPDGTVIRLVWPQSVNGAPAIGGANFTNTVFDDEAAQALVEGTAPYTGTFRPKDRLWNLDGKSLKGTWTLYFTGQTEGTLNNWSIIATASPMTIGGSSGVAGPAPGAAISSGVSGSGASEGIARREAERLAIAGFLRHLHGHG